MDNRTVAITSVAAVVVGTVIFAAKHILASRRLKRVGILGKLVIYPIKSVTGIELERAECTPEGLEYGGLTDRQFLLIDEKGAYISHYDEPTLALLRMSYVVPDVIVEHERVGTLKIPVVDHDIATRKEFRVKMRIHTVVGADCGEEAQQFFQNYLERSDVRLVRFLRYETSPEEFAKQPYNLKAFHNWRSFHLLSQASLDDLNTRLPSPSSYKNFRPNFVIEECSPYEEDHWKAIQLGDEVVVSFVERNFRCLATSVDPEKGTRTNREPYKTLSKYRVDKSDYGKKKYKLAPLLGILLSLKTGGVIQVGDPVFAVTSRKPLL